MKATLVYLVKDNQVLLAMKKRGHGAGKWNGPGGKVNPGESIQDAARRECQEEVGLLPGELKHSANVLFEYPDKTLEVAVFTAKDWSGILSESDEMRPKWFDVDKLPLNEMWENDTLWIPRLLAGEKLQATFIFNEGYKLLSSNVEKSTL